MQLHFTDVGKLPPPVLQFADVTFGYSKDRVLYRNVRFAASAVVRILQLAAAQACTCLWSLGFNEFGALLHSC